MITSLLTAEQVSVFDMGRETRKPVELQVPREKLILIYQNATQRVKTPLSLPSSPLHIYIYRKFRLIRIYIRPPVARLPSLFCLHVYQGGVPGGARFHAEQSVLSETASRRQQR